MLQKILYLPVIFLLFVPVFSAAPDNEYKITYTIDIESDGTAVWNVEYRTILVSDQDFESFENYTQQLQSVYLKEFKELMQKSAAEAAAATSRRMIVGDFTGDSAIQSTLTGTYGIIRYSFTWTNFAKTDNDINIGDVFIQGLALPKDNTLIIKYPYTYTVDQVAPPPDQTQEGLIWDGRNGPLYFGPGEPKIILKKTSVTWLPIVIAALAIAGGAFIYLSRIRVKKENPENITQSITEIDEFTLEDRIVKLLKEGGGSLYQSDIGKKLNLPKSTVSAALNELYNKNIIQKIKKGRENLIRLV